MHIIYFAATMNYSLGSNDPEELVYYNKIRKVMDDIKKEPPKSGILILSKIEKPNFLRKFCKKFFLFIILILQ